MFTRSLALRACLTVALTSAPFALSAAPASTRAEGRNLVFDGYRRNTPGPDIVFSTPKPGYPFSLRKDNAEAIIVLRVFFTERGIQKIEPVAFHGDQRLLKSALEHASRTWRVQTSGPMRRYQDVPIVFVLSQGGGWVARYNGELAGKTGVELADAITRLAKKLARKPAQP